MSNSYAVLFPGQGSQSVGMGKDLYEKFPQVAELYDKAGEILGFDLAGISFNGPEEELTRTKITQPAIYTHSYAVYTLLKEKGFAPAIAAGHSLGEYSALAAAGYFGFEQGLKLVAHRGEFMQKAGDIAPGTMAAVVGLDDAKLEALCLEDQGVAVMANLNSPGQTVISGSVESVDRVMEKAKEAGAKIVRKLSVSGAFHSPLMQPARDRMKEVLNGTVIRKGTIPVVTNVNAAPQTDPDKIRDLLLEQITGSVRWYETVEAIVATGASTFYELGPGAVLTGLLRRIDRKAVGQAISTVEQVESYEADS